MKHLILNAEQLPSDLLYTENPQENSAWNSVDEIFWDLTVFACACSDALPDLKAPSESLLTAHWTSASTSSMPTSSVICRFRDMHHFDFICPSSDIVPLCCSYCQKFFNLKKYWPSATFSCFWNISHTIARKPQFSQKKVPRPATILKSCIVEFDENCSQDCCF